MYFLLCGYPPFQGKTEEEIFYNIKKYNINFDTEELKKVSDNYKNLLKRLLNQKKEIRIKAFEALKLPFFTEKLNPLKIMSQNKDFSIFKKFLKLENIMLFNNSSKRGKRFTILNEEINSNSNLQNGIENNYKGNSDYIYEILKYEIKLIDFGCSKYLNKKKDNELSGIVGTNIYTP